MGDEVRDGTTVDAEALAAARSGAYGDAARLWFDLLGDSDLQATCDPTYVAESLPLNYSLALYLANDGDVSAFRFYGLDGPALTAAGMPNEIVEAVATE